MAETRNVSVEHKVVPTVVEWEYTIMGVMGNPGKQVAALNEQGAGGWELVSVNNNVLYLKRPIQKVESNG